MASAIIQLFFFLNVVKSDGQKQHSNKRGQMMLCHHAQCRQLSVKESLFGGLYFILPPLLQGSGQGKYIVCTKRRICHINGKISYSLSTKPANK